MESTNGICAWPKLQSPLVPLTTSAHLVLDLLDHHQHFIHRSQPHHWIYQKVRAPFINPTVSLLFAATWISTDMHIVPSPLRSDSPQWLPDITKMTPNALKSVRARLTLSVTRSHKQNDRDHAGLADGTADDSQHLPRFFAKNGHIDSDPNKVKKEGGGKGNW